MFKSLKPQPSYRINLISIKSIRHVIEKFPTVFCFVIRLYHDSAIEYYKILYPYLDLDTESIYIYMVTQYSLDEYFMNLILYKILI